MIDVMIDLEFLAKPPMARITSIGACRFDIATGEIGERFYERVDWAKPDDQSLPMHPETIEWWLKQPEEARLELTDRNGRDRLPNVLNRFSTFFNAVPDSLIWGNGDDCDCVILGQAYASINKVEPWEFWQTRDVRTIVDLCQRTYGLDVKKHVSRIRDHHALYDAIYQAGYVSLAFKTMTPVIEIPL